MNTPTISSSVTVVNDNRKITKKHECTACHYALFPNTGFCTNRECAKYHRSNGATTSEQLLREYRPPTLFHGRRWGLWTLDTERLCLVYDAWQEERGNGSGRTAGVPPYVAHFGKYELDLETIRHSAAMLDWIFQVGGKSWASARVTKDLLNAFDSIFHPQQNLCSGGGDKVISNPTAFLRRRIASVGNDPQREAA